MDTVLQALLTWQFIVFCLAVATITLVIRKIVEYILANNPKFSKESKVWRDVALPILPILVGVAFALIATSYPYPVEFHVWSARFAWGLTGGLLSGWVYRIVNVFISSYVSSKSSTIDTSDPNGLVNANQANVPAVVPAPVAPVPTTPTDNTTNKQ